MKIKQQASVHNRFDVKVIDALSGDIKQTAVGYNVILNTYFSNRLLGSPSSGSPLIQIAVGNGSGTPAVTDTELFNQISRKEPITLETSYAYPTSYIVKQIKLEANELNGHTITEVGFMHTYTGGLGGGTRYYRPTTHAMLQDSEGNPIAILKTDTDIVYINATFFVSYTPSGFGSNGIYPKPENNFLVRWLMGESAGNHRIRFSRFPLESSSELEQNYTADKTYTFPNAGGDMETYQKDIGVITFLDTESNNQLIKHFGVAGIGAFSFPNAEVFPDYPVNQLILGEGDGVTSQFNIKSPLIKSGSVRIYIDGEEMSSGWTADTESNCFDRVENYHTASMTVQDEGITFGDIDTRNPAFNYDYGDPMAWWTCTDRTFYPSSCTVSETTPIFIDFKKPKVCNRLRIRVTIPAARKEDLTIQYSHNNEVWQDVTNLVDLSTQNYTFDEVSAQYWRVFVKGANNTIYNWTYYLYNSNLSEYQGQVFRSTFFLGRSVPGLMFDEPVAAGKTITASYLLDHPYKTENNLLRFTYSIQLQRG